MRGHRSEPNPMLAMIAAGFAITTGVWVGAASQQPPPAAPAKQFDEASIRPCDPDALPPTEPGARGGGPNSFQMTPGRTHAQCMTLATLIRTAYGYGPAQLDFLQPGGRGRGMQFTSVYGLGVEDGRRVKGGPDWVRSDRYTIDAVADDAADAASMSGPMLRTLIEKRFQLKAHIEQEQVPAFALTVAPGGLKIKPVADGSCERQPPIPQGQPIRTTAAGIFVGEPPVFLFRPASLEEVRRGAKPACGARLEPNGPNMTIVGGEATIESIGRALAGQLGGVQVFDRSGVADKFNFVLEFVRDKDTPGVGAGIPPSTGTAPVPPGQNIYAALQDQLGVKLEPARASRDVIVIDSVQGPSPN